MSTTHSPNGLISLEAVAGLKNIDLTSMNDNQKSELLISFEKDFAEYLQPIEQELQTEDEHKHWRMVKATNYNLDLISKYPKIHQMVIAKLEDYITDLIDNLPDTNSNTTSK